MKTVVACIVTALAVGATSAFSQYAPFPPHSPTPSKPIRGKVVCKFVPDAPPYQISKRAR